MLIEFTLGNYRSFDEPQTFSMVADTSSKYRDAAVVEMAQLPLLKVSGIYGANASGKSNFFLGLQFLRQLVISSFESRDPLAKIAIKRFALRQSADHEAEPASFGISFTVGQAIYSYQVALTPDRIESERLCIDDQQVFNRVKQNFEINRQRIHEAHMKQKLTKPTTLFISVLAATDTKVGRDVMSFFRNDLVMINGLNQRIGAFTKEMINSARKSRLLNSLKNTDLAINDLYLQRDPMRVFTADGNVSAGTQNQTRVRSRHAVYDESGAIVGEHDFDLELDESNGTQRFLNVVGPLLDAVDAGKVVLADEFGSAMHPLMVAYLIDLFQTADNQTGAQLLFNTQDVSTMDNEKMRVDQIWFAEKDRFEATHLLSLGDYRRNGKPIRPDLVFNRQYLKGAFGAIPMIRSQAEEGDNERKFS